MNVNGTKELPATREAVWNVINDPAKMAGLMPGVKCHFQTRRQCQEIAP